MDNEGASLVVTTISASLYPHVALPTYMARNRISAVYLWLKLAGQALAINRNKMAFFSFGILKDVVVLGYGRVQLKTLRLRETLVAGPRSHCKLDTGPASSWVGSLSIAP